MKIDTGLGENGRKQVTEALKKVLADSYTLYLKTHNYHWNITGSLFQPLHGEFEKHYTELALAVDEIAERIRALGFAAPGSYKSFAALTVIEEANDNKVPAAEDMVKQLAKDNETIVKTAREALSVAEDAGDDVSVDLLTQRMAVHEKTAWMLRSFVA